MAQRDRAGPRARHQRSFAIAGTLSTRRIDPKGDRGRGDCYISIRNSAQPPTIYLGNGMLETIHHTLQTQPVLLIFLLIALGYLIGGCLLYTSPSPRDS